MQMTGSFDPVLVVFSIILAIAASYTALELARRVAHTKELASTFWLIAGAISMGIGIWTMHFVGMLAFSMNMSYTYDVPLTVVSLLVGIGASAFAIHIGSQKNVSKIKIGISGIILGGGIASMHYVGMAAMKMQAVIHYDPLLLCVSIVIAIVGATTAIWIAFNLANTADFGMYKLKLSAAVLMGTAICGMHYIGMLAASYEPLAGALMIAAEPMQNTWLALSLGLAALMILGFTHLTIFYDYKLTAQIHYSNKVDRKVLQLGEILDEALNEIYLFDADTYKFISVNKGAQKNLGYDLDQLEDMTPADIKPEYTLEELKSKILQPLRDGIKQETNFNTVHQRADGSTYPVNVHVQLSTALSDYIYVAIVNDITEKLNLENQIIQSKKLESIGQLAAGIAHEINTPAQFVGDNTRFLKDGFDDLIKLITAYQLLEKSVHDELVTPEILADVTSTVEACDPDYLKEEIPVAIQQTIEGISRISNIVLAMKEFSHPGGEDKEMTDLNKIISNTIVVASNEWKYVAEVVTEFDEKLPPISCHPQEISQVLLNLIVNAAHAMAEKNSDNSNDKGEIKIVTQFLNEVAEIRISDSGCGIPEDIRDKVFDLFYTTKEVGKGTGQGLSMAYTTITDKHNGSIEIESEVGNGTTFIIRLPTTIKKSHFEEIAA